MKLQNVLPHMRNTSIRVNGTSYLINGEGVVDVSVEADCQKLLANAGVWRHYVERNPVAGIAPTETKPMETPVVEKKPVEEPVEVVKTDITDESHTDATDEYPDPKMSMTVKQLQNIADAYDVIYDAKTTKTVLVDRIMKAMYGEE